MIIKKSGLFDEAWYRRMYPDVAMAGMDPVEHYLWIGAELGRDPGPAFNTKAYVGDHAAVAKTGQNPLLHYVESGGKAPVKKSRYGQSANVAAAELAAAEIGFSVIMPTRNRAHCIEAAIDSLIEQTHFKFELVIVDDGSTDGTQDRVLQKYASEIEAGRIVYVRNQTGSGVCAARNIGLSRSSQDWITYLDSDNTVRPEFLSTFADAIVRNPETETFYANFQVNGTDKIGGQAFNVDKLADRNFIDIGVFCHSRNCYKIMGAFDRSLKRLVDWELILRYTKSYTPVYLPVTVMDYCNEPSDERITRSESYAQARVQVHRKHNVRPTVSVVVLSYNQEKYIEKALESALMQEGPFTYEIILADDGSTDKTPQILRQFARKNPHTVRNISSPWNMGISENFKRAFEEASGEYVAILEGDDFWTADDFLATKVDFMQRNPECSMVFSKIKMMAFRDRKAEFRFIERQEKLTTDKLDGNHFLANPSMNLIVNFSTCMFRTD
ncbi:MAG: glycosyltransferase, partial [Alteraurantiacibacter sp.]